MPVDKSADRVRQMFAEIAGGYDRMNHLLSMQIDRYWRWRTVRALPLHHANLPILDVCTGTGDLALAFWKKYRGSVPIVATDFCPEMLQIGEHKKARLGIGTEVTFLEGDTEQLPFDSDRFQLVTVAFGLRNVSSTDRGLQEMTRVCAPGGMVAVLEFSLPRLQPFRGIYGWYFRHILPRLGQWLMSNRQNAYHYLPESVREFPEGKAMLAHLTRAGLEQCREIRLTLGVATLYLGSKPHRVSGAPATARSIPASSPLPAERVTPA